MVWIPLTAGEVCPTCGHKPLPKKPLSWLRNHIKYWWSFDPEKHFNWTIDNLKKQFPDGITIVPDEDKSCQ